MVALLGGFHQGHDGREMGTRTYVSTQKITKSIEASKFLSGKIEVEQNYYVFVVSKKFQVY